MSNKLLNNNYFNLSKVNNYSLTNFHVLSELSDLDINSIAYLQDDDAKNNPHARIKVIKALSSIGEPIKIRICENKDDAHRIFYSTKFIYDKGLPVSRPIQVIDRYVIFSYNNGRKLKPEDINLQLISKLGAIHAKLNSIRFPEIDAAIFHQSIKEMINNTINILQAEKLLSRYDINKLKEINFPSLHFCMEHDDMGIHNIIIDSEDNPILIDEEGFGVLPFGFGLIKPLFDKSYCFTRQRKDRDLYMRDYSESYSNYFKENIDFFLILFCLRNSVRKLFFGNKAGALSLIDKVRILLKDSHTFQH